MMHRLFSCLFAIGCTLVHTTDVDAHATAKQREALLDTKVAKLPEHAPAYIERASWYRQNLEFEHARKDLRTAYELDPTSPILALEQGLLSFAMGDAWQAIVKLDRFLRVHSLCSGPFFIATFTQGRALSALGQYEKALQRLRLAQKCAPHSVEVYLHIGHLFEQRKDFSSAQKTYQQGLDATKQAIVLRTKAIDLAFRLKQHEKALELLHPVLEQAEIKTQWYLRIAQAHQKMQNTKQERHWLERAKQDAELALRLRRSPLNLYWHARVLLMQGNTDGAIRDLKEVLRRAPRFSRAHTLLRYARKRSPSKSSSW